MMKNDERIENESKSVKNVTYYILWVGVFCVLLYRWFFAKESLLETLDLFLVFIIASLIDFFMMAAKGIPLAFPVELTKKEQLIYIILVPFFVSFIPVITISIVGTINGIGHAIITYMSSYASIVIMYSIYKVILYIWEKRNIDKE